MEPKQTIDTNPLIILKPVLEKIKKEYSYIFAKLNGAILDQGIPESLKNYLYDLAYKNFNNDITSFKDEDFINAIVYAFWDELRWKRMNSARKAAKTRKRNIGLKKET